MESLRPGRSLELLLRRRHLVLWLWTAGLFAPGVSSGGGDWRYFVYGSDLLVGRHGPGAPHPGGLHLFANYPELHMGPLSLLLAGLFRAISPGDGRVAAIAAMCALGPVVVLLVERGAVSARGLRSALDDPLLAVAALAGGVLFCLAWIEVAGPVAHLDDVLVLLAAAVAAWSVATRRPFVAALAIGLAIGSKSWGVLLLPLLACFPRRVALRAAALAAALAAVAWLPFLLADHGTLASLRAGQTNDPASGLRALGVHTLATPHWLRPLQIGLALGLGLLAVSRKRWPAALLLAVGVRLALDPAVFGYYMPGLVLGGLVCDLVGPRRPLPVWTLTAYLALQVLPQTVSDPRLGGIARVGVVLAAAVGTLVPLGRPGRLAPLTSPAG
jgi:hypothetical protein